MCKLNDYGIGKSISIITNGLNDNNKNKYKNKIIKYWEYEAGVMTENRQRIYHEAVNVLEHYGIIK
jgi:hypothetical protein